MNKELQEVGKDVFMEIVEGNERVRTFHVQKRFWRKPSLNRTLRRISGVADVDVGNYQVIVTRKDEVLWVKLIPQIVEVLESLVDANPKEIRLDNGIVIVQNRENYWTFHTPWRLSPYESYEDGSRNSNLPVFKSLYIIPGVEDVRLDSYEVIVTKAELFDWGELDSDESLLSWILRILMGSKPQITGEIFVDLHPVYPREIEIHVPWNIDKRKGEAMWVLITALPGVTFCVGDDRESERSCRVIVKKAKAFDWNVLIPQIKPLIEATRPLE